MQKYHNRLIDAAAVIQAMLKIKQDMENDDKPQLLEKLGITVKS